MGAMMRGSESQDMWFYRDSLTPRAAPDEETEFAECAGVDNAIYSPAMIQSGSEMEDDGTQGLDFGSELGVPSPVGGVASAALGRRTSMRPLDLLSTPSSPQPAPWTPREQAQRPAFEALGGGITFVTVDPESGEIRACNPYGTPKPRDAPGSVEGGYSSLLPDDEDARSEAYSDRPASDSAGHNPWPVAQQLAQGPQECKGCEGKHVAHTCGRGRSGLLGKRLGSTGNSRVEAPQQKKPALSPLRRRDAKPRSPSRMAGNSSDSSDDDEEFYAEPRRHHASPARLGAHALAVNRTVEAPAGLEGLGSGSGWITVKISAPKPVQKCSYELCYNPFHTSGGWKWVTEETKAGGRDWTPYIGRLFCNACFTQYATTGSMSRKGRVAPPPLLQENPALFYSQVSKSPDERRHAGGMSLRRALHASHKSNV